MHIPTYTMRRPEVFALQYTPETERTLIEEVGGAERFFALGAEFGDFIVDDDGAIEVVSAEVFHRNFHRIKDTTPVISELQAAGVSITRIAEILGVSRPTVYRALNA